jgi:hypothetical protein
MPDPEEARFTCVGCGASNPTGSEACSGCGHRFSGPDLVPEGRNVPTPRPVANPYEAPSTPITPSRNFRIGTALMLIAVVAFCLGALRANIALGIAVSLSLVPAAIRTPLVAGRRRSEGAAMDWPEQVATFAITIICTWLITIASSIAFLATCYPAGMASASLGVGLAVGVPVAIGCAVYLTILFIKIGRGRAAKKGEIRYH